VVPKLLPASNAAPERLETGTQNHEAMAGAAAAVDFLAGLSSGGASGTRREQLVRAFEALHHRGIELSRLLVDGLAAIPGVRVHGVAAGAPRTPTVAFTVSGIPAKEVSVALAREAVFVSTGDFYATTLVAKLGFGREGLVRAGAACYTTAEEVERLVAGVAEVAHSGAA
jgi:selenocysteine lyase/cysteine desulfurase